MLKNRKVVAKDEITEEMMKNKGEVDIYGVHEFNGTRIQRPLHLFKIGLMF